MNIIPIGAIFNTCVLAAIFFFVGNSILIAVYVKENGRVQVNVEKYQDFDVDTIREEWDWREGQKAKFMLSGVINGMAWFLFVFPLVQLAYILSFRGVRQLWFNMSIALVAIIGGLTEWMSRLLYFGQSMAGFYVKDNFNLMTWIDLDGTTGDDGVGWKVLELTHIMTRGLIVYVDAFEYICLFVIMLFLTLSIRRWKSNTGDYSTFNGCFQIWTMIICILSLSDFVTEIVRFQGVQGARNIAFWIAAVNRLIMIPLWLLYLSCRLPVASTKLNELSPTTQSADDVHTNEQLQQLEAEVQDFDK